MKPTKVCLPRLALALCLLSPIKTPPAANAQPGQPINTQDDRTEPVHLSAVELGGFWKQQVERLTEKWLPHCIRELEKGGEGQDLLRLIDAGKQLRGEPVGNYKKQLWTDAYIYNTMEAACLALEVDPTGDRELVKAQIFLRKKIEEWIPIILAAQEKDGYIDSYYTLNGKPHFMEDRNHEFYVMGYFLEMGVAHYHMTGGKDKRLYDAAVKCANMLCEIFGPAPKRTWRNGHPGMEYALCRLGRLVNEVAGAGKGDKYIALARHFLDHQNEGEKPSEYNQSDKPAVELSEARGHAVRATYFYTAMADIALLTGSVAYQQAVDRIWANAIHKKHYLTGGVGASHKGEAFAGDFELPNDGYCESCASCGLSFWSDRMHRLYQDAHYRDVQERVLYNNLLGSIELSGENFYYQNPLDSDKARYPWHNCPCCVGNIPRALLAIKDLIYSVNASRTDLYLSHFVDSEATLPDIGGALLRIQQSTRYPWDGDVTVTLHPLRATEFTLRIRIPNRTESELYSAAPDLAGRFTVRVNGQSQSPKIERGYIALRRSWKDGDRIELSLPMEVQRVHCDQRVTANRGRVALQRGPVVYSVEDVDHSQPVKSLVLKPDLPLKATWKENLLGGVMVIEGAGIIAVPNYARLNRGGASQVWLVEDPAEAAKNVPQPPDLVPGLAGIQKRTIDFVVVGDESSEHQHALQGDKTAHGEAFGHQWRHAGGGGWFSYRMKVGTEGQQSVFCVYWGSDGGKRVFDLLVDGERIATQELEHNKPNEFFAVEYPVPVKLTAGKQQVTVKFQAHPGSTAGGVFDCRILMEK